MLNYIQFIHGSKSGVQVLTEYATVLDNQLGQIHAKAQFQSFRLRSFIHRIFRQLTLLNNFDPPQVSDQCL
jgi:hypothetical protein